jgi:hypothetical protein
MIQFHLYTICNCHETFFWASASPIASSGCYWLTVLHSHSGKLIHFSIGVRGSNYLHQNWWLQPLPRKHVTYSRICRVICREMMIVCRKHAPTANLMSQFMQHRMSAYGVQIEKLNLNPVLCKTSLNFHNWLPYWLY